MEGGRRPRSWVLEVRDQMLFLRTPPSWLLRKRSRIWGRLFLFLPPVISLLRCYFLGRRLCGGQKGACNTPPSDGLRTGNG